MVPEVSNPRIEHRPLRFVVSVQPDDDKPEQLSIDQLSGGYRIMLALAADLARRMAQGNPHLDDPLRSEAVVLIDEIELHLHPSWQQRVMADLARTFPNTQFIVSTHSPQVLTTVRPEHVVELRRERGGIVRVERHAPMMTHGGKKPVKRNRSCGEAKQDAVDPDFVDPRMLPALPSLTRVRFDGQIRADEAACADAAVDADKVKKTIDILGLNVERLRLAREKRWRALSDNWRGHHDDPQMMVAAARVELSPGDDARLPRFFTTSRSYFAPVAEEILAETPQAWI